MTFWEIFWIIFGVIGIIDTLVFAIILLVYFGSKGETRFEEDTIDNYYKR